MDLSKYKHVLWALIPLTTNTSLNVEANTAVFTNQGTQNVTINGVLLLTPGQGFTFQGYPGEVCVQSFDIIFTNERSAGCKLVVALKEYKD